MNSLLMFFLEKINYEYIVVYNSSPKEISIIVKPETILG